MKNKFLLGADPEVFLFSQKNNKYVSAIGMIGGTKEEPMTLISEGYYALEDNVMVEFNIPPTSNPKELYENIQTAQEEIAALFIEDDDLKLVNVASAEFEYEELDNNKAQEFGCMPEEIVWTGKQRKADAKEAGLLRTAAGHIHIGAKNINKENLVKSLDLFLGVPSTLIDKDTKRVSLYGMAGSYRDKPYGLEYRVLSNFWINSRELISWIFNQVDLAITNHNSIDFNRYGNQIMNTINNKDLRMAEAIVEEFSISMPVKTIDYIYHV